MCTAPYRIEMMTPTIGAEILDIDLTRGLETTTVDWLRNALLDHLVLFFRDQPIDIEQQLEFGRQFGDLHVHPAAKGIENHPEVFLLHTDASSTYNVGDSFHSDVSCDEEPPMGSILHLCKVPPCGGDTLFVNMYAAYDGLSDSMKSLLSDRTAIHESEHLYDGRYGNMHRLRDKEYPRAEHPVIRTHPETGKKALFVNSAFTQKIVGLSNPESQALLDFLFDHIRAPEYQCRFRWQQNSIAFWDNRVTQHYACWDYYPHTRTGHRVTIKGDKPF